MPPPIIPRPSAFNTCRLADLIWWILSAHAAPTLIVACCGKDDFIQWLRQSYEGTNNSESSVSRDRAAEQRYNEVPEEGIRTPHPMSFNTIRTVAMSATVQLAFCTSVQALLGLLGSIMYTAAVENKLDGQPAKQPAEGKHPMLVLINPLAFHSDAATLSGQTLSKIIASTVHAGTLSRRWTIVAECSGQPALDEALFRRAEIPENQPEAEHGRETTGDAWATMLTAVDPGTRAFGGSGGDGSWANMQVSAHDVARRWLDFMELPKRA